MAESSHTVSVHDATLSSSTLTELEALDLTYKPIEPASPLQQQISVSPHPGYYNEPSMRHYCPYDPGRWYPTAQKMPYTGGYTAEKPLDLSYKVPEVTSTQWFQPWSDTSVVPQLHVPPSASISSGAWHCPSTVDQPACKMEIGDTMRHPVVYAGEDHRRHSEGVYAVEDSMRHSEAVYDGEDHIRHSEAVYTVEDHMRHTEAVYAVEDSIRHAAGVYANEDSTRHLEGVYAVEDPVKLTQRHTEAVHTSDRDEASHGLMLLSAVSSQQREPLHTVTALKPTQVWTHKYQCGGEQSPAPCNSSGTCTSPKSQHTGQHSKHTCRKRPRKDVNNNEVAEPSQDVKPLTLSSASGTSKVKRKEKRVKKCNKTKCTADSKVKDVEPRPKYFMSAFAHFMGHERQMLKQDGMVIKKLTQWVKESAQRWKALCHEAQQPYRDIALDDRQRYYLQYEQWKQRMIEAGHDIHSRKRNTRVRKRRVSRSTGEEGNTGPSTLPASGSVSSRVSRSTGGEVNTGPSTLPASGSVSSSVAIAT